VPYVFERFRQADSSITRMHGGLGLGLAIVRYLVEMHGGAVSCESEGHGRGATFVVRLPLAPPSEGELETREASAGARPESAQALRGTRVLLVDDDMATLAVLGHALTMGGAHVTTASSVAEALSHFEQMTPDVVVSDLAMPHEDGIALIGRIRAREGVERSVRAVAVTAFGRAEDRLRALEAGYDDFLTKPVLPRDVVSAIARALGPGDDAPGR